MTEAPTAARGRRRPRGAEGVHAATVMSWREAPHAGDGGDSMNHTPTQPRGQRRRSSRAHVSRAAGLLGLALLVVLAAAAIVPGAARAATYNTWTKQTSGITVDPLRHLLLRRQQRLARGSRRRHRATPPTAASPGPRRPRTPPRPCAASASSTSTNGWASARPASSSTPRTAAPPGLPRPRARPVPSTASTSPSVTSGWLVGGGGVIRHTTNGGTTWATQTVTGTHSNLVRRLLHRRQQRLGLRGQRRHPPHHQRRHHLDQADVGASPAPCTASTSPTPTTAGPRAVAATSVTPPTAAPPGPRRRRASR